MENEEISPFIIWACREIRQEIYSNGFVPNVRPEPDGIIFAIGINDSYYLKSKRSNHVPLKKFESNISALIKQARRFTKRIVFIGLTSVDEKKTMPISWKPDVCYSNGTIDTYDKKLRDICLKLKIPYVGVRRLLKPGDLGDGLHPDSRGHKKMFQKIYSFLKDKKIVA